MSVQGVVDAVLEAPVFTSFTRIGYDARSRAAHWTALDQYRLQGRVMLVTGATSGLGLVTTELLAKLQLSEFLQKVGFKTVDISFKKGDSRWDD